MNDTQNSNIDLTTYNSDFGIKNKLLRLIWGIYYLLLFRPFGSRFFKRYRVFILKCFGANLDATAHVYSSVKIWAPWNLTMGANSTLGPKVDCYNQGTITIGSNTVISQKTYLCASTHDFEKPEFPLICKPIRIGDSVWVAADAFVGPGVTIGDGAVVGARASVFKKVDSWTVVGGNPSQFIKERVLKTYE
ncbi:putative colanic acid biosynthesis acetyltransferase [Leeuwenhoekiella aestuarii]|uniref:Putative colanic acid biosynthesis acetyltransferase WcaF n=1 Tax=Leeuwenhoekiella aestuarii TaxID=2249426 RepID=A0A4V1KP05_9FLAO|nr:putative colanic acid biosynthesis acetyltransferase [Leeuwenhoekiella aestuarii]RXG13101.1 putative colanic acid biosynthesis acetyltransferase WcaF [Leeuwenhoekiella aestuarii]